MKTRIARDVATARRPGRPIPAALGTAGWAQAAADRARIRSVLRAPPDWRAPATTSVPASTTKHGAAGAPIAAPPANFQAKLTVSSPGDIYEQEADRIAGAVAAPGHPTLSGSAPRTQRLAGRPSGQMDAAPASA